MAATTPDLATVFRVIGKRWSKSLRVALPCRVQAYDNATQRADLEPLVDDIEEGEDGIPVVVKLPLFVSVPVSFPRGGGMSITWPLVPGDTGLVIFADRAIDDVLEYGNRQVPTEQRSHDITDAVFIPGLSAKNNAVPDADASVIAIGRDGASADFAALAGKVTERLDTFISLYNAHGHTGAGAGAPIAPITPLTAPTLMATVDATVPVASTSVKIKG